MSKRTPALAPLEVLTLCCYECGNKMRLEIERYANGKIQGLTYYCDSCEYSFISSMPHPNGQMSNKYKPPAPAHLPGSVKIAGGNL